MSCYQVNGWVEVYICVRMCIYVCAQVCVCVSVRMCGCKCASACMCLWCVCLSVCVCVWCLSVCLCGVCLSVCVVSLNGSTFLIVATALAVVNPIDELHAILVVLEDINLMNARNIIKWCKFWKCNTRKTWNNIMKKLIQGKLM